MSNKGYQTQLQYKILHVLYIMLYLTLAHASQNQARFPAYNPHINTFYSNHTEHCMWPFPCHPPSTCVQHAVMLYNLVKIFLYHLPFDFMNIQYAYLTTKIPLIFFNYSKIYLLLLIFGVNSEIWSVNLIWCTNLQNVYRLILFCQ